MPLSVGMCMFVAMSGYVCKYLCIYFVPMPTCIYKVIYSLKD